MSAAESFAYDRAERKHRAGKKITEAEWEILWAGERAALERAQAELAERDAELEWMSARIEELEARVGG